MPGPGMRWRHVIINTRCSWLHGDPRGYRDRDHRTHSSGNYKRPPPAEENEGLRRYFSERARTEIVFHRDLRPIIGRSIARISRQSDIVFW
jgi:hypothetical protein